MAELELVQIIILIVIGLLAGVINTLAGGGSNLSLPALMMFGLPADVANATNRVSVLFQSLTASVSFYRHKKVASADIKDTFLPLLAGGFAGALVASYLDVEILKPVLLATMIATSFWVVLKSNVDSDKQKNNKSCYASFSGLASTFLAGFYGGFIQAGVGFVLIAAFVGVLNYDLLRANALKVIATLIFTSIALVVFIFRDQVAWIPGLILAVGSIVGAQIAVKFAISISAKKLKVLVLLMTVVASIAALII